MNSIYQTPSMWALLFVTLAAQACLCARAQTVHHGSATDRGRNGSFERGYFVSTPRLWLKRGGQSLLSTINGST